MMLTTVQLYFLYGMAYGAVSMLVIILLAWLVFKL